MGYERVDSSASTIAHYVYDHTGNRILKGGINTASLAQNGQSGSLSMTMDPYTVYVNPYYVVERFSGGPNKVSKHYLVGMERVATNLGEAGPAPGPEGSSEPNGTSQNEPNNFESPLLGNLKFVLSSLGKEEGEAESMIKLENPKYEDYYSTMLDAPEDSGTISTSQRLVFYYHPDYLGNVEFITDMDGYPYQYFWYSAWGESLINEKDISYSWESPYRFNGKELDEETGLLYYGARYYDPQISAWLSVDPLSEKYPNLSAYVFSGLNPINIIDPDGRRLTGPGGDEEILVLPENPDDLTKKGWVEQKPKGVKDKGHSRYFKKKDSNLWLAWDAKSKKDPAHYHLYEGTADGGIIQKRRFNAEGILLPKKLKKSIETHLYPSSVLRIGRAAANIGMAISFVFDITALITDSPLSPIYINLRPGEGEPNRAYIDIETGWIYEWRNVNGNREVQYFRDYDYKDGEWRGIDPYERIDYFDENGNRTSWL